MDCPACGSDDVRRITETDLACRFCGHEWCELPAVEIGTACESPEDLNPSEDEG
jgi:ribosomal protein L37AE/L43A